MTCPRLAGAAALPLLYAALFLGNGCNHRAGDLLHHLTLHSAGAERTQSWDADLDWLPAEDGRPRAWLRLVDREGMARRQVDLAIHERRRYRVVSFQAGGAGMDPRGIILLPIVLPLVGVGYAVVGAICSGWEGEYWYDVAGRQGSFDDVAKRYERWGVDSSGLTPLRPAPRIQGSAP
jgi:hypothetical protein